MKRKIFFSTAVLLAATAVHALEIMCAPTGEIHFREPCTEIFLPTVYMDGWHGLSCKGPWAIEKDGRALFRLERENRKKMDGSLSLERRPDGRARVTYTFTATGKATFETVACTIRLPIQSVEGNDGARMLYEIAAD